MWSPLAIFVVASCIIAFVHAESCTGGTDYFGNRETYQLKSLYTFDDAIRGSDSSKARDTSIAKVFGDLTIDTSHASYDSSTVGLTLTGTGSVPVSSTATDTLTQFKNDAIAEQGITFEMWVNVPEFTSSMPLFYFGEFPDTSTGSLCDGVNPVYVQLVHTFLDNLMLTVRSAADGCTLLVVPIPEDATSHIVIVIAESGTTVYVDGVSVATGGTTLSQLDLNSMSPDVNLHLGAWYDGSTVQQWDGDFYLFAMYARPLSAAEVTTNREAFVANSLPTASDDARMILEDTRSTFTLAVADDFDQTEYGLIDGSAVLTVEPYISGLPHRGTLYQFGSDTPIAAASLPVKVTDPSFRVDYLPEPDEYSAEEGEGILPTNVYTRIRFQACDGLEFGRNGTIDVHVESVNDPPKPIEESQTVYAGVQGMMQFRGSDVDLEDNDIGGAIVRGLPTKGTLYQVTTTVDGPELGAAIGVNDAVTDSQFRVYYIYDKATYASVGDGQTIVNTDEITFSVEDLRDGTDSGITAILTAEVNNDLQPETQDLEANEEEATPVALLGSDQLSRSLRYRVTALPTAGTLSFAGSPITSESLPFDVGSSWPDGDIPEVTFVSDTNYYDPTDTAVNFFSFRMLDLNGLTSAEANVTLFVNNVNDQPVITMPERISLKSQTSIWVNITIEDVDWPDDEYEVTLEALNRKAVTTLGQVFLDQYTDQVRLPDGYSQSKQRFEGTIYEINLATHLIDFLATSGGDETLSVIVTENVGGPHATEVTTVSASTQVDIEALGGAAGDGQTDTDWLIMSGFWGGAAAVVCMCGIWCRRRRKRQKRAYLLDDYDQDFEFQVFTPRMPAAPKGFNADQFETFLLENMAGVLALLEVVDVDEADDVCSALICLFESHNQGSVLLHGVINADLAQTPHMHALFEVHDFRPAHVLLRTYGKMVGMAWLHKAFAKVVEGICLGMKGQDSSYEALDEWRVMGTAQNLLGLMLANVTSFPLQIRYLGVFLSQNVPKKFPDCPQGMAVGSYLCTHFLCAALRDPKGYQLTRREPDAAAMTFLSQVATALSNIASGQSFDGKFEALNVVLQSQWPTMEALCKKLTSPPFDQDSAKLSLPQDARNSTLALLRGFLRDKLERLKGLSDTSSHWIQPALYERLRALSE
eukprot:Rmarinus@m.15869